MQIISHRYEHGYFDDDNDGSNHMHALSLEHMSKLKSMLFLSFHLD